MIFDQIGLGHLNNQTLSTQSIQLDKIEMLLWSSTHLTTISPYTFINMDRLEFLALNGGNITQLDSNTFEHPNSQLSELELSDNPIKSISPFAFVGLKQLTRLSLDNIEIPILFENILSSLTTLETLSLARQSTLVKFNWLAVLDLPRLTTLDLSQFTSGKSALIDSSLSARIKSFINLKLKSLTLRGYEFTDEDTCDLLPTTSEYISASFPLIQLDNNHKCSCFVIQAFKFWRLQFNQSEFALFSAGISKSPECYRLKYNTVSYYNLSVPPNELLIEEQTCEKRVETVCRDLLTSLASSTTVVVSSMSSQESTAATKDSTKDTNEIDDTNNEWDEKFYRKLLIAIGSVSIGILVLAIIILIIAIVIVCRVKNDTASDKYELREQESQVGIYQKRVFST